MGDDVALCVGLDVWYSGIDDGKGGKGALKSYLGPLWPEDECA